MQRHWSSNETPAEADHWQITGVLLECAGVASSMFVSLHFWSWPLLEKCSNFIGHVESWKLIWAHVGRHIETNNEPLEQRRASNLACQFVAGVVELQQKSSSNAHPCVFATCCKNWWPKLFFLLARKSVDFRPKKHSVTNFSPGRWWRSKKQNCPIFCCVLPCENLTLLLVFISLQCINERKLGCSYCSWMFCAKRHTCLYDLHTLLAEDRLGWMSSVGARGQRGGWLDVSSGILPGRWAPVVRTKLGIPFPMLFTARYCLAPILQLICATSIWPLRKRGKKIATSNWP